MSNEIEDMPGVRSVSVRPTEEDGLEVNVILESLEFSAYERVIQKELDLFDKFPNLPVRFNVDFFVAPQEPALSSIALSLECYDPDSPTVKRLKEIRDELLILQRDTQDGFK